MKVELKSSLKLKNKTTLIYTVTSLVAVLIVGCFAFFYFNMGASHTTHAAAGDVVRSTGDGDWGDLGSWDITPARIPEDGDRVIIESGDNITVDGNESFNGEIIVNGELEMSVGSSLVLNSSSKIAVNNGGEIIIPSVWGFPLALILIQDVGIILNNEEPLSLGTGAGSLLPIELASFDAQMDPQNDVAITWTTSSEENNDFFTIERSLDGRNFFALDTLTGAGNSHETINYSYLDDNPVAGNNYYRLKQTDYDGKSETFNIVSVYNDNAEPELSVISIGPNPYVDQFEVNFYSLDNNAVHLKMSDMHGRTIFAKSLEAEKGHNSFTYYNEHREIKPGIYLFTIVQKGTPAKTFRLIKSS